MTEHKFLKLISKMENLIDHEGDTVRYYPLCDGCVKRIEYSGIGSHPKIEAFRIA